MRPDRVRGPGSGRAPGSRARRPDQRRRTSGVALPAAPARRPGPQRRRRGGITTRAAFLALLVCGMTLALTVPMRQFFAQRERLVEAQARQRAQAQRVADLEAAKERLQDPAYVERLARERLRLVRPGEVPFIVIAPSAAPRAGTPGAATGPPLEPAPPERAWYAQLWQSVEEAGAAPAPTPRPTPDR